MAKYKVVGRVTIDIDTWINDDGKTDLNYQAYDQIRDLVLIVENCHIGDGDVEIADIEIDSVTEVWE